MSTFAPPRITTPEQLDAVPAMTVVRSGSGTIACRNHDGRGYIFGDHRSFPWDKLQLPARILWQPTPGLNQRGFDGDLWLALIAAELDRQGLNGWADEALIWAINTDPDLKLDADTWSGLARAVNIAEIIGRSHGWIS